MSTVENPYAFPGMGPIPESTYQGYKYDYVGMTLRDYFAAKAMQSLIISYMQSDNGYDSRYLSEEAYRQADQMLKARES